MKSSMSKIVSSVALVAALGFAVAACSPAPEKSKDQKNCESSQGMWVNGRCEPK